MNRIDPDDATVLEARDPLAGTLLDGRYRLEEKIADGGFGSIYRGTQLASGRAVAIKILHRHFRADPGISARFRREAAAMASLHDPHTVAAYDHGETHDGTLYIVMELLVGQSLYDHFMTRGGLPWQHVVAIARGVCSSLGEAHALGIVHRDLKPANIYLERRGFVKVLDFGIAKIMAGSGIASGDLTYVGQMIGTFEYMPPEQLVGGVCTPRSDVFSLGVVMYEMLSGARPFGEVDGPAGMLAALFGTVPAPLSALANVPPALDRIVMRCLDREPLARYADAVELAAELEQISIDSALPAGVLRAPAKPGLAIGVEASPRVSIPTLQGIALPPMPRRLAAGTYTPVPGSEPRAARRRSTLWILLGALAIAAAAATAIGYLT